MMFCLDDGAELLYGPASASEPSASAGGQFADEPKTAILSEPLPPASGRFGDEPQTAFLNPADPKTISGSIKPADEGFWVAVIPFRYTGSDPDIGALADGLSDEIITGLSRFSYLRVIARSSVEQGADKRSDTREIGREIGARYVMEGSLRQAGSTLRVAVKLVDASTGALLWAETYDRQFSAEGISRCRMSLCRESFPPLRIGTARCLTACAKRSAANLPTS